MVLINQYNPLKELKKPKVLKLPHIEFFGGWDYLQIYIEKKGNPLYSIEGHLDLYNVDIFSLGSLTSVGGRLYLSNTNLSSLGSLTSVGGYMYLHKTNLSSLENLIWVGGDLILYDILNISSLGNLTFVGGHLDLRETNIKMTKKEIKKQVNVIGNIYI